MAKRGAYPLTLAGILLPTNRQPGEEQTGAMVAEATPIADRIIRSGFPDVEIPDISITECVLARAAERGDKPALIEGATGRTLTYAQLADMVRRVAAGLA